ncbi:MAG: alpha-1,2-fucosyltransferase [Patescibacteria group bacterium]
MTVIIKTIGGLGNQLFQYAFARGISSHLETSFLLDIDTSVVYKNERVHEFSLQHFNVTIPMAKWYHMYGFVWLRRQKRLFNFIYHKLRLKKMFSSFYFIERLFCFDENVLSKGDGSYFEGFWNTEKYFKNIEKEIRKEIIINKPLSEYGQKINDEIMKKNSISLHVRRTDYVTHKISNEYHGTCSQEYYKNAIKYVAERVPSPHFFIFSDDYGWVVENFKFLQYPYTCIKNGPEKNYEDLTLMSKCKHHIIANSTFSWWGAWLNPKKDKIVIGPKQWFKNAPKANTVDLFPDGWIKL